MCYIHLSVSLSNGVQHVCWEFICARYQNRNLIKSINSAGLKCLKSDLHQTILSLVDSVCLNAWKTVSGDRF